MKRLSPPVAYTLSAVVHVGIFVWAWKLPARAPAPERVDVEIVETIKPKPVEPKPSRPSRRNRPNRPCGCAPRGESR